MVIVNWEMPLSSDMAVETISRPKNALPEQRIPYYNISFSEFYWSPKLEAATRSRTAKGSNIIGQRSQGFRCVRLQAKSCAIRDSTCENDFPSYLFPFLGTWNVVPSTYGTVGVFPCLDFVFLGGCRVAITSRKYAGRMRKSCWWICRPVGLSIFCHYDSQVALESLIQPSHFFHNLSRNLTTLETDYLVSVLRLASYETSQ